jgi:hypothetical protein
MFLDLEHGVRQHAFRTRLLDSGVTAVTVADPGALETALVQALLTLPRPAPERGTGSVDNAAVVDGAGAGTTRRHERPRRWEPPQLGRV